MGLWDSCPEGREGKITQMSVHSKNFMLQLLKTLCAIHLPDAPRLAVYKFVVGALPRVLQSRNHF